MTICDFCKEDTVELYFSIGDMGEEYITCKSCFEKFLNDYRKGKLITMVKNEHVFVEVWNDAEIYIIIIYTEIDAIVKRAVF